MAASIIETLAAGMFVMMLSMIMLDVLEKKFVSGNLKSIVERMSSNRWARGLVESSTSIISSIKMN